MQLHATFHRLQNMAVSDIIAESKQVLGYKEAKHLQTNL